MPANTVDPIATPQRWQDLQDAVKALNDALHEIRRLEACGQDCQAYHQATQQLDLDLRKLLQVYFPNGNPTNR